MIGLKDLVVTRRYRTNNSRSVRDSIPVFITPSFDNGNLVLQAGLMDGNSKCYQM